MKKELIHFVEWKKIPEEKVESALAELRDCGVKNIVAHPVWFRDGKEHYVRKMAERLDRFSLKSTACHALWSDGNDCIIPDPEMWTDMICRHRDFLCYRDESSLLDCSLLRRQPRKRCQYPCILSGNWHKGF